MSKLVSDTTRQFDAVFSLPVYLEPDMSDIMNRLSKATSLEHRYG
jgi:hypothetical protein